MNTEMLSPELQLNNMLEQINAQLPNNKAQKVSEIMNSVLGGEMLLRHVGFYKALGGLGDKISKTYNDITSGESSVTESVINNIVPESLQPLARGVASAVSGEGTQALTQAVTQALPESVQPLARGVASAVSGEGTQALEQAVTQALPESVQPLAQGVASAISGEGTQALEQAVTQALPESVQPLAQGVASAISGEGTQALEQAVTQALPESVQPLARGVASAVSGEGTAELEQAVAPAVEQAVAPVAQAVQRTVAPVTQAVQRTIQPIAEEIEEQGPGLLDRFVTGVRNLGGRISSAVRGPRGLDDPAPSRDINLDDPMQNLTMDDPFSEGPVIDMASRRGLFRVAPEVGQADSGQNIGNAFSQARATGELPNLPVFDGMREVPQSSAIQEQQASANRAFNSDELPDVPAEERPQVPETPAEQPPAPETPAEQPPAPETPAEQPAPPAQAPPATQETGAVSAEEDIPATIAPEDDIANIALPELETLAGGTIPSIAPTVAKIAPEIAETGFELGPLVEGVAIVGSIVPQLISLFEKPEAITESYVGDQIGL